MEKTYLYDKDTQILTVYANSGVHDYCKDNGVRVEDFNIKVIIDNTVTDCSEMLMGCSSFNHRITVPRSVTNCTGMFYGCVSLSKPVTMPESLSSPYKFDSITEIEHSPKLPDGMPVFSEKFVDCAPIDKLPNPPKNVQTPAYESDKCSAPEECTSANNYIEMFKDCRQVSLPYQLNNLLTDSVTLFEVLSAGIKDYKGWFRDNFPNGAHSAEEVINKAKTS